MRWSNLTLAALLVLFASAVTCWLPNADAQQGEPIKPYVVLIVDTSGSMVDNATGQGPPSCAGTVDTRFDHAKCAIQNLVNTHGDITFSLARFRHNSGSGSCLGCGNNGINCQACNENTGQGCSAPMSDENRFELMVPLIEDAAESVLPWVDFTCGNCGLDPADDPELDASGWTPIGGSLRGVRRYFQGADPFYATDMQPIYGAAAGSPIANDPLNEVFIDGEQCRPYVVISLTDGAETCEVFSTGPEAVAGQLLSTPVTVGGVTRNYRITTRPIGFGQTPGNAQIEALAHAGGATDVNGEFEGFYANSEEELSIAFNQIISDSLKVEVCNNIDDDCDGLVDEGYQKWCDVDGGEPNAIFCSPVADDCDEVDDNCVDGTNDEPKNDCGGCGPLMEECNLLDDDCDGAFDEGGVCGDCTPQGNEVCDNEDDDCDGFIDEDLTRPCGTDVGECEAGEETCNLGNWENCTATGGSSETCDGLDNDCDGSVDGFARECVELPGNMFPFDGVCQAGTEVCPAGGTGMFEECLGEIGPSDEACDGIDNDCDAIFDEDTGGEDCSSDCGIGTTECVNGMLECNSTMQPMDEVCNGLDDDCDSIIDEMVPEGDPCDPDGDFCEPGQTMCIAGAYECVGGVEPGVEICDCVDNDCDGSTDEEPPALCGEGASCVDCQCALPCAAGEFPCGPGQICEGGFCLVDPCYQVDCPPVGGEEQACDEGACVSACSLTECDADEVCRPSDGECARDDCVGFPERCDDGELCLAGECVTDACYDVSCGAQEYCLDGACVGSCSQVECPEGQSCERGACTDDLCIDVDCGFGGVCNPENGQCIADPCTNVQCDFGEICDKLTGVCERDACLGVDCPGDEVCDDGTCGVAGNSRPEIEDRVSASGGGGCSIGGPGSAALMFVVLLALGIASRRRRDSEEL